jgi:hypothetical protein
MSGAGSPAVTAAGVKVTEAIGKALAAQKPPPEGRPVPRHVRVAVRSRGEPRNAVPLCLTRFRDTSPTIPTAPARR